jgi:hypothetical protein
LQKKLMNRISAKNNPKLYQRISALLQGRNKDILDGKSNTLAIAAVQIMNMSHMKGPFDKVRKVEVDSCLLSCSQKVSSSVLAVNELGPMYSVCISYGKQ